jgi:hypothetical protein
VPGSAQHEVDDDAAPKIRKSQYSKPIDSDRPDDTNRPSRHTPKSYRRSPDPGPMPPRRGLWSGVVRGGGILPELLTLVDGPLAKAVSKAADYTCQRL